MPPSEALTPDEIDDALAGLKGWAWRDDALVRHLTFDDFRTAMGFLVRVGFEAEALDHHPDLHNVYNRVDVRLTTHSAGNRVTRKDVQLARRIEALIGG